MREHNNIPQTAQGSKKKFNIIGCIILVFIFVPAILLGVNFYNFQSKTSEQLNKVSRQIEQLPELEEDIFTKCMEENGGDAKKIAFCQENTQKQMHILAQELDSAKKDLQNKEWYENIKFI